MTINKVKSLDGYRCYVRLPAFRTFAGALAMGGSQNFLGAKWVGLIVRHTPPRSREKVALKLIAISPHYFYDEDPAAGADRLRTSRNQLVNDVLDRYLHLNMRVIDFGCGPGYCSKAVANRVKVVEGVDISIGVLACAEALNGASNIEYETPTQCSSRNEPVDLVFSFAVVQHMSEAGLVDTFAMLRRRLKLGGTLIVHFALPENGWRTEMEWQGDTTLKGMIKRQIGLRCSGRTVETMTRLLNQAGFAHTRVEALCFQTKIEDDIATQYIAVAS
jgi:cyclopropane fatty-acyl-phospholipid synthase-like methyltransferase